MMKTIKQIGDTLIQFNDVIRAVEAGNYQIEAGDTVVVPLDADRIKPLTLWTSISQVFYQIALGAAAVASF